MMMGTNQSFRESFRRLALVEFDVDALVPAGVAESYVGQFIRATDVADEIFWQQISPEYDRAGLLTRAGDDEELKEILLFNYGPYDRLNGDAPVLPVEPKFSGMGFYPRGLTREKLVTYLQSHPEGKAHFESPYTIIRRTNSHLTAIPYHEAYRERVSNLSEILKDASKSEPDPQFSRYLSQRAADLLTDDYYDSDRLWVELENNPIDFVVGPYEVYEDQLMGLKAGYEAAILCRDFDASTAIRHFQNEIPALSNALKSELGTTLQIESSRVKLSVANLVYAGGEAKFATPAIAFNLPNDERVLEEVGGRQVILRNVLEAKFHAAAWPILIQVIQEPEVDNEVAFQAFFHHTLLHEISHSVGPHRIVKNGEATTVNRTLREYYSVLEEAKADVLAACFMLERHDDLSIRPFLETYVAGFLRPIRFGLTSAHGGANAIQFNFLLQEQALAINPETKMISLNPVRLRSGISKLAAEILRIQVSGDFDSAKHFVASYNVTNSEMQALINKVADVPVDIRIRYKHRI